MKDPRHYERDENQICNHNPLPLSQQKQIRHKSLKRFLEKEVNRT